MSQPTDTAGPEPIDDDAPLILPRDGDSEDDLDMTPMVDVTFLLLIFFMVTAAFSLQKSINVPTPEKEENATQWAEGTHLQFGITSILCEGAGALYTKQENVDSGVVLMKTIAEHYKGLRR